MFGIIIQYLLHAVKRADNIFHGAALFKEELPAGEFLKIAAGVKQFRIQVDVVENHVAAPFVTVSLAGENGKDVPLNQATAADLPIPTDMGVQRIPLGDESKFRVFMAMHGNGIRLLRPHDPQGEGLFQSDHFTEKEH